MTLISWTIGFAFFALFLHVSVLNAFVFWNVHVRKRSTASWIPLVGGVFGTISLGLIPVRELNHLWWLPLVLDYGCLPGFAQMLLFHSTRFLRERSSPTKK